MWPFGGPRYPVLSVAQAGTLLEDTTKRGLDSKIYDYIVVGGELLLWVPFSLITLFQAVLLDAVWPRVLAKTPRSLCSS
jgi:hypothetical protein